MTPLDETQRCPVFSRVPPGVYIHAPLQTCEWCDGSVTNCAICGGMGPYRPLINIALNRPVNWQLPTRQRR
jgi:hypothetical protein